MCSYEARLGEISRINSTATANYMQAAHPGVKTVQSNPNLGAGGIVYQICEKKGHSARDCFNRDNVQQFPARVSKSWFFNSNRGAKTNTSAGASVNVVWYPDNGASDHVTSDPNTI